MPLFRGQLRRAVTRELGARRGQNVSRMNDRNGASACATYNISSQMITKLQPTARPRCEIEEVAP